jgi:hypothetical protein
VKPLYVLKNPNGEFFAAWTPRSRRLVTTVRRAEAKPMHVEIAEAYAVFFRREKLGSFSVEPFRQSRTASA